MVYKNSSLVILALIFLLPLFFIPGGALSLATAKSLLIVLALVLATIFFLYESWHSESITAPRHYLLVAALVLPLIYLLSALLSTPSSLSLFGYNFEIGTFGYVLVGSLLLLLTSLIFKETSQILHAMIALFASLSLIAIFVAVKILYGGDFLALGNFFGNMGNPLGNWTDLAMIFGLLTVLCAFILGMLPMKIAPRILLYAMFLLSTALLVVINFSVAYAMTLGASLFLLLYFSRVEKEFLPAKGRKENFFSKPVFLPALLVVVSLMFLINPTVPNSDKKLTETVSGAFNVANADVRPTFGATLGISKAVLTQTAFLGSGPNTFSHDWLIYKPIDVNVTPFWAVAFPFGVGFLPTQIASTGIAGTTVWLAFFVLLIALTISGLIRIPESRGERFAVFALALISLFIWIASFAYVPSAAVLMMGFIFAGLFLAISRKANVVASKSFNLKDPSYSRLSWKLLFTAVVVGVLALGYVGFEKTVSAYHFKKAIDLSNKEGTLLDTIEGELNKAVKFAPADIHYIAISRLNFSKAQLAANSATGTPEQNRAIFEDTLAKSIQAAKEAVRRNPSGWENWVTLGTIYAALVPEPLKVDGAYENAQFAYSEALRRNPNNPELALLLSRLELGRGNIENARSYIRSAIALKDDYPDAYLALAQLEIQQNNIAGAIASAERLVQLLPNNSGIYFELGFLKYSNKDYEGAKAALSKALELTPDYANAKYYLALTLSELQDEAEARRLLEELLEKNPGSAELKQAFKNLNAK